MKVTLQINVEWKYVEPTFNAAPANISDVVGHNGEHLLVYTGAMMGPSRSYILGYVDNPSPVFDRYVARCWLGGSAQVFDSLESAKTWVEMMTQRYFLFNSSDGTYMVPTKDAKLYPDVLVPQSLLESTGDALEEAWGLVQEMCFHNPPGCEQCPNRCEQDDYDEPMEAMRIMDTDNEHYWDGCQYEEIPRAINKLNNFLDKDNTNAAMD